jgi:hypothetical protein
MYKDLSRPPQRGGDVAKYPLNIPFYDKNGRLICKKVASSSVPPLVYMSTYYVYDILGKLQIPFF